VDSDIVRRRRVADVDAVSRDVARARHRVQARPRAPTRARRALDIDVERDIARDIRVKACDRSSDDATGARKSRFDSSKCATVDRARHGARSLVL